MAFQFNALQVAPSLVSLTGINLSLFSVGGGSVEKGLMAMTGNDICQAIRALHTTRRSGGYARLDDSLKLLDAVLRMADERNASSEQPEPLWCKSVLTKVIVRGKCVGYSRNRGPVRIVLYNPPQALGVATRRILAVAVLWLEIKGPKDLEGFILECANQVAPDVSGELEQELIRLCTHLCDDIKKAGLGVVHEELDVVYELLHMIEDRLKSQVAESKLTGHELVDLFWTFHVGGGAAGGKYWTNDALVFHIWTVLRRLSPNFPDLDYNGNLPRHELEKPLLRFKNRPISNVADPWLVRCRNEEFWELMWLHNRGAVESLSEYQYVDKVNRMRAMLMEHTKLSPIHTEDKGLCSLISFDSTRVPIHDTNTHRQVERACVEVLLPDFAQFARVATAVEFFNQEELKASEAPGSFEGGKSHVLRTLDLKLRTIALLVLQTIVMKSLADGTLQPELILYTPGMHTGVSGLAIVFGVLTASGSCIPLWRVILVSAWFLGGTELNHIVRERRSDMKDCIGVMGPRVTVVLNGVMNGSDDSFANNKLWICNGPVPDLPTTPCGLTLVDSAHIPMSGEGLFDTYDQDVTPLQADVSVVIDVGPSYGTDEDRIRSWIRSDGYAVGHFNPVLAMSRIVTNKVECKCISRGRIPKTGVYRGWPVKMSELVQKPNKFISHIISGSATKLIFLVHQDKTWRYCLASLTPDPVIVGDCECILCVGDMLSEKNLQSLVL